MLVLYLLSKEDMYGYQITQAINRRSDGQFPITDGALYIVLYRLIKKGYISKRETTGKNGRVFYHLDASGKTLLDDLLAAYVSMHQGVMKILEEDGQQGRDFDE